MTDATDIEGVVVRRGLRVPEGPGRTQGEGNAPKGLRQDGQATTSDAEAERLLNGGLLVRQTGIYQHHLRKCVLFTPCVGGAGSWVKPSGTGDAG